MLARAQRAREREARAREHQDEALRKAEASEDPVSAQMYRDEARTHARAVEVQREGLQFQREHAREHKD
jgi:hypothetical protein